ncbi:MAG TPA: hypothetical protein VFG73_07595 [Rhodanobacteraceae bacterium]|nr:hypothetical protein [Rhodanobacteraceae bacterium]
MYGKQVPFRGTAFAHAVSAALVLSLAAPCVLAAQVDIAGPPGSVSFGATVKALPNGNFVVVDPDGPISGVGAVYVYRADGTLLSTLTGSSANDHVGRDGILLLGSNRFVVVSSGWNNGTATQAGAVTWIDGSVGLSGVVSASNSLVGTSAADEVGSPGVTALSNGNYVVASAYWNNGTTVNAGAATWCDGAGGCVGPVSASNSLVGTSTGDRVGLSGATALGNGNYVVASLAWSNGATATVGAATWGNGTDGIVGPVSPGNSLVGTSAGDQVGSAVIALSNGNYVVASPWWHNGATAYAGAVTWGNGASGSTGQVSASNSLVGTSASDQVGDSVTALSNGNYVVASSRWHNGATASVGAATWGNGAIGSLGPISPSNSLVGTSENDFVGVAGVTALSNGNYVVVSPDWNNSGMADAGAVTWCGRDSSCVGAVSASNSLVGTSAGDQVGSSGVTPLSNGNYVVASARWNNGATAHAGAATWGNGASGIVGPVSTSNSLAGMEANDHVGFGVTALSNGKYVVASPDWNNSGTAYAGAVTWCGRDSGCAGSVSASNSLVGTSTSDTVGSSGVTALSDGNFVVASASWDNGANANAGAVTLLSGDFRFVGTIASWNSVLGDAANGGQRMSYDYDPLLQRLIVGRPAENIVSLFAMDQIFADGFQP